MGARSSTGKSDGHESSRKGSITESFKAKVSRVRRSFKRRGSFVSPEAFGMFADFIDRKATVEERLQVLQTLVGKNSRATRDDLVTSALDESRGLDSFQLTSVAELMSELGEADLELRLRLRALELAAATGGGVCSGGGSGGAAGAAEAAPVPAKVPETEEFARAAKALGQLHFQRDEHDEALAVYEQALTAFSKLDGWHSERIAAMLAAIALVLQKQEKLDEALEMLQEKLNVERAVLGAGHAGQAGLAGLASTLNDLAGVLCAQGRLGDAESLYKEALGLTRAQPEDDGEKEGGGEEHVDVAVTLNNLGRNLCQQHKFDEATEAHQGALSIFAKLLGWDHAHICDTLFALADVLRKEGKLEDAQEMMEEELNVERRVFGVEHAVVATTLGNLAGVMEERGALEESIAAYEEALRIAKSAGSTSAELDVAAMLHRMADVLNRLGRWEDAMARYQEELEIRRAIVSNDYLERPQQLVRKQTYSSIFKGEGGGVGTDAAASGSSSSSEDEESESGSEGEEEDADEGEEYYDGCMDHIFDQSAEEVAAWLVESKDAIRAQQLKAKRLRSEGDLVGALVAIDAAQQAKLRLYGAVHAHAHRGDALYSRAGVLERSAETRNEAKRLLEKAAAAYATCFGPESPQCLDALARAKAAALPADSGPTAGRVGAGAEVQAAPETLNSSSGSAASAKAVAPSGRKRTRKASLAPAQRRQAGNARGGGAPMKQQRGRRHDAGAGAGTDQTSPLLAVRVRRMSIGKASEARAPGRVLQVAKKPAGAGASRPSHAVRNVAGGGRAGTVVDSPGGGTELRRIQSPSCAYLRGEFKRASAERARESMAPTTSSHILRGGRRASRSESAQGS